MPWSRNACASAAYYIASGADKIYVDKASIVGSIGVLMDGFGFTGLMEKLGVERRLMTAGENKGFLDPFSPQTEKQRAWRRPCWTRSTRSSSTWSRPGRGKRLKETPETFSGLFWSGQQAIELGLVDQLGNLDYVAREVVKAEDLVDYTRRENVAERLAKRFGAAVGEGAVRALKSAHPALIRLRASAADANTAGVLLSRAAGQWLPGLDVAAGCCAAGQCQARC
jgi:protease-4